MIVHVALSIMNMTLFDKLWHSHLVVQRKDGTCLLYIDGHMLHEVTSPQAFDGVRHRKIAVRRPDATLATPDHNVPTTRGGPQIDPLASQQLELLISNCSQWKIDCFPMGEPRQGVVHVVGPEQGFTLPGMTIVCGDSHTATHGAFGALAFGIGTAEVEHVLATQTLLQKPQKNMRIKITGELSPGITAKDLILAIIGKLGTAAGTGHVIEYTGEAIDALSMEARMTLCNMSIELGARAGLIAPDETTFAYLKGRPYAPTGPQWEQALSYWQTLHSDTDAEWDKEVIIDACNIAPQVSWGTSPQDVVGVNERIPVNAATTREGERALNYMALEAGAPLLGLPVDQVFIGSCTNGRIEDLQAAAAITKGRKVADHVRAFVVPGSGQVKIEAEQQGLDRIFIDAGFEWRHPGCSMCCGMNPDQLGEKMRAASTSNRNFENRQGRGGRTHLMSPAMAAAAAVSGCITDVRELITQANKMHKSTGAAQ